MKVFVIADLHLSHSVDKPMDRFGARWDRHQERLAENWQALVSEEDTVLVPGDISWAINLREAEADLRFLHELPGRKILMRGNHDYWWQTLNKLKRFCEEKGFDSLHFLQNNALPLGQSLAVAGSRLWLWPDDARFGEEDARILEREKARLALSLEASRPLLEEGRHLIVTLHYPPFGKNLAANEITAMIREAGAERVFFGHIHQSQSPYCLREEIIDGLPCTLIAADHLAFKPYFVCEEPSTPQEGESHA